jgi:argininosuccinate lyase
MILNAESEELKLANKRKIGRDKSKGDILRSARLGKFSPDAAKYTSSTSIDGRLLPSVIAINSAHVLMLFRQNVLARESARRILSALRKIPSDLEMSDALEDVHMNVESRVISETGKEVGGMLNLGKSRNDQVSAALRIKLREELLSLGNSVLELESAILAQARRHASTVMPGYTHLQRAQAISLGHHLLSYCESLERDLERILECYARVNRSPMGAGALASTSLSIDREYVAELLGFDSLIENSLDAVSSRDFAIEAIFVFSQLMADISRLAEELILWSSNEFHFVALPDEYSSTSSMMPQKKNPVVAEVARAHASQVFGDLSSALGIAKSLPLSYNLDLQELTHNLWSSLDKTVSTVDVFANMINGTSFNVERLLEASKSDESLYATDLADYLVTKYGVSFREAHARVASLFRENKPLGDESKLRSILQIEVSRKELEREIFNPLSSLKRKKVRGSPNPVFVLRSCTAKSRAIRKNLSRFEALSRSLTKSKTHLDSEIEKVLERRRRR